MPVEYNAPLTKRELEIVALVAQGMTNREIAQALFVSHNTVKVHLRNIFVKTGVVSRTELTMLAVQRGWIVVSGTESQPEEPPVEPELPPPEEPPVEPEAPPAAQDTVASEEPLPPWPVHRSVALALGAIVALLILLWPTRNPVPETTSANALVDQPQGQPVAVEPTAENPWEELAPLPVRRARLALAALDGHLYAIGGMTAEGPTGRLDVYDFQQKAWHTASPRPLSLANVGAVVIGKQILVPGGCDASGQPHREVHSYDPRADVWKERASLPTPLCAYALTSYRDRAYLFGGWDGKTYRALAYVYDPQADSWQKLPPPTVTRGFGAAASLEDGVYYVGGYDGKHEFNTCEVYRPQEGRWETCAAMLLPRGGLGLTEVGGQLYAIGGGWLNYLGFNERYNPTNDSWQVWHTPLVGEWRNLGLTVSDTSLYAVGGWSGDYLNTTYRIEVLPWRIFVPTTMSHP